MSGNFKDAARYCGTQLGFALLRWYAEAPRCGAKLWLRCGHHGRKYAHVAFYAEYGTQISIICVIEISLIYLDAECRCA